MTHILIVDDDAKIRSMLRRYLEGEGFEVSEATNGEEGYAAFLSSKVDMLLLDLTMPGGNGLEVTRKVRMISQVPIIILTGKDDPVDKAIGLEVGADDYIAKPFHLREVLARINTVLRRSISHQDTQPVHPAFTNEKFGFENWMIDFGGHCLVDKQGKEISLTSAEFKLLSVFVRNAKRVMNRDQLLDQIAGREWTPYDRTVDTQVRRLRMKLEVHPDKPELIKTVRGEGYVFTADVNPA
jgi:two-component system phosphate regulon response regulator OmpR